MLTGGRAPLAGGKCVVPTNEVPSGHGGRSFWRRLTAEERAAFSALATWRTHRKGATLIHRGAADRWAAVIWSGRVRVIGASSAQVIAIRAGGDIIGEQALMDGGLRSATVVAESPTRLLLFDSATMNVLLARFPRVQQVLIAILSERLRELDERLAGFAGDAFTRIVRHLLAGLDGQAGPGSPVQTVHIGTQAAFGARLGISRDSVIRALRLLRGEGSVTTGRGWVAVRDAEKLRRHLHA
jgi:CRP/FNR family cyclic AMP-dependent transcriptional regulator